MKLHLPLFLRKCLLLVCAATAATTAWGGGMHSDVAKRTYSDFGQNKGRFRVTGISSMLQAIRDKDGGIAIPKANGDVTWVLPKEQGMINFSGSLDYGATGTQCHGAAAAFGANYLVTVAHNPGFSASFGVTQLGSAHSIKYSTVQITEKDLVSAADWGLYRQNKIYTDVVGAHNYSGVTSEQQDSNENGIPDIKEQLEGELMYRAFAGSVVVWEKNGNQVDAGTPYTAILGGISTIRAIDITSEGLIFGDWNMKPESSWVNESAPLPTNAQGGDSGSPVYVYNQEAGRYEYIFSLRAGNATTYSVAHGSIDFANEILEKHSVKVDMSTTNKAQLGPVSNGSGLITVGDDTYEHLAVNSGSHTWKDLSDVKNNDNWYAYGNHYQNSISELGNTQNLIFTGSGGTHEIILNDTVDTGVGYLEFNNGSFTVKNADSGDYMLNSAGYVINEGAEVHVQLTNPAGYMREWRKNGAGDLYIEGEGDNNILLAVGGSGTTYLDRQNGHAAYNVLASSGAKVVISDTNQIERAFTFGLNGGTLDMNGNSMDWYTTNSNIEADGFSINALTDDALIVNSSGSTTMTYKQAGNSTWKGSLKDSTAGSLSVIADMGAGAVWTMNSICTDLSNNAASSFTVKSGTVVLAGINTEHGTGSVPYSDAIFVSEDDWHYADARMNVTVENGATFRLGTHARVKGDITVNEGGTYVMNEGVHHQMEYIEGGIIKENTGEWAEYYGHQGNTTLAGGALKVEFADKTTATHTYAGNITGTGTVSVDAANSMLVLTGNNTFSGSRSVVRGTLMVEDAAAAGSEKWLVGEQGAFAARNADGNAALQYIDSESTGVLALSQNQTSQIDVSEHDGLIIGALAGQTIQYGTQGTTEQLEASKGVWRLGGGGGNLVVNYHLTGDNMLVLGNEYTKGVVTLTNSRNDFTGGIDFAGSGVTLDYTSEAAIKHVTLNLRYGNRIAMSSLLGNILSESDGILLVNNASENLNLSNHAALFLGSKENLTYTGNITVSDNQAYRLSAGNGTLAIDSRLGGAHDLIVDAQGYSGGVVQLNNLSELSGNVTVMGYDRSKSEMQTGDITLKVTQDNVLDGVDTITLKAGGTLHIGDSTQHISNLVLEEGSSLLGNRLESGTDPKASELHITIGSISDIKGLVNVDTIHKYGSNTLELNNGVTSATMGNLRYRALYIEEGDVRLTSAYSSVGSLYLGDCTLHLNGKNLNLGTVIAGDGATIDASASGSTIGGNAVITVASGTATLSNGTNAVTVGGRIGASEGATLRLTGSGDWMFTNYGYNLGGTLRIEDATKIAFSYGSNGNTSYNGVSPTTKTVTVSGTLDLAASVTHIQSAAGCHVQELDFNTIKLNGQNLTLEETTQQAVWRIRNLEASEDTTITWNASHTTTSSYRRAIGTEAWEQITETNSSRLILNGENSFTGKIIANRTANGAAHNSYVELAHDKALQHGTLELNGYEGSTMSLAVNTNNARIQGLTGNEHTLAYSGESSRVNLDAAPTGDGKNTLTITGSGRYDYKGAVNGLNIAMDGTGTQVFSGSNIKAQNITALQGNLEFTHAPTVADTISIAQGATLKLSESYSLNEGVTLALIAGNGTQGTLSSTLVLNGGTLEFDSTVLNATTSLLNATTEYGSGFTSQAISFSNHQSLEHGATYTLLSGDWSEHSASLAGNMPDYLSGSIFAGDSNGLKVTIRFADGFAEWQDDYSVFSAGKNILFRDHEPSQALQFTSSTTAGSLRFTNNETYSFSGSDVTLTGDLNVESGKLVLNNKVTAADYTAAEGEVEIAATGTLVLTDTQEPTATVSNISGTGMLQLSLGTDYGNKLAVDETFEGTTRIAQGNLTLTGSTFGNTLKLANGVNAQITAATTIDGNLELEGTTQVHQNSGNKLTVNGDVTGSNGTWERRGGGTLDINGSVSLAGFDTGSDSTTSNFNGTTEITTVTLDQGNITANFNGNATVGTLNPSGTGVTLGGTGKLSVGNFNLASGKSVTIDALSIVESAAQTRSWNNNTINLKNGAVLDTRNSYYNHQSGTLTIGGSGADGIMYMKGICMLPADLQGAKSELTISAGAHLIIAGDKGGTTSSDFVLAVGGEYSQLTAGSNKINISGTLTSNAAMTLYYKSADVDVLDGGRMNLLDGLELEGSAYNEWVSGGVKATLSVQEGGQLYAAGGTNRSELLVNIASGATLGAIGEADSTVTFRNNMTLGTAGKDGTITVDTAATTADDNFLLTRSETMGVTVDMTGSLNLQGNTTVEVIGSGALRHKDALNKAAAIHVQEGASLAVDSSAGLKTAVALNKGRLVLDTATASGSLSIADAATIHATGGRSTMSAAVTLTNDATVTYNVDADAILDATGGLSVVSSRGHLVKQGEGFLKVKNEADALTSIAVEAGSMNVYGTDTYDLNDLKILSESTLMLYEDDGTTEATVNVSGSATFAAGASLYANLVLSTGVNLDIAAGGLSMGSSVSLQEGVLLSDTVLARIHALSAGEHLTLFTGVDGLELSGVDYAALLETDAVLASSFFSNIGSDDYLIIYTGAAEGTLGIVRIVPEPATATLSLLALCGLVARRRRK